MSVQLRVGFEPRANTTVALPWLVAVRLCRGVSLQLLVISKALVALGTLGQAAAAAVLASFYLLLMSLPSVSFQLVPCSELGGSVGWTLTAHKHGSFDQLEQISKSKTLVQ